MHSKSQKQLVLTGAARFNAKPKAGLAFLEENKLIYADLSPKTTSKAQSLATFLKNCTRLDKRLLGDFISKPDNIEILKAFIGLFDFKNVSPTQPHLASSFLNLMASETHRGSDAGNARSLSTSWRSTADSSNYRDIRVHILCVGTRYQYARPLLHLLKVVLLAEIRSEDAVYVLAYSVIMLNTDLHNPQIRVSPVTIVTPCNKLTQFQKRMTIEEYRRNLRGVNDGANFSPEYLVRSHLGFLHIFPDGDPAKYL